MPIARRPQRTIAREAEVRGVSFLGGLDVRLRFRPAGANEGITFVRADLPDRPSVPAHVRHVIPRQRRTTIERGPAIVEMVEHVMAALAGLRIDNAVVEIDGPETPGCDGSSRAFSDALADAGIVEQSASRDVLVIDAPITVREGDSILTAHPGDPSRLVLGYNLDYGPDTPIGRQSLFVDVDPDSFRAELAPSRTFLLQAEADALRASGIGSRTTEKDLLIFGRDGVIGNELRYRDECVRHKILDLLGDLALIGMDLAGHVVAHRSGHSLNAELARKLLQSICSQAAEAAPTPSPATMDINEILKVLPHRYPFLLIDRVVEFEPGHRVSALKNVSINEPFFQGHWPGRPIMPGVLIIEALAQAAGILIGHGHARGKAALLASIDKVKLRRQVIPGDQLRLDVDGLRLKGKAAQVRAVARVGDRIAAEAKIRFVVIENERAA
ncbi:UDP-3-O-acyl-N-acetylglucosamine deacetylase [Tundrisphaera sp. TA3]|uniref:UDP-3-O-acyl-N-acetylglucosamine deacetylase n=1 Tax=Tundrisphaera sp. TA3 TaxID=3435775 RepID=UPI003EBF33FA